ncbi:MAG: methyltransferase [Deltaproteobacteria bacterium]|nr:methyltransferase [Deltaproteobacteria bacterium]
MEALDLYVRDDEHCASLTRDFFILQRRKGHRYSVDDLLVAFVASSGTPPARVLDLGCGIGSVILMVGWAWPDAKLVGIEAQQESTALALRNLSLNEQQARTTIVQGDLRDHALLDRLGTFDLVTGTPPYFDPKAATPCSDPQRAHAKFELRGGIEDYAKAAALLLAPAGRFIVCSTASPPERGRAAITDAGLFVQSIWPVLPGPERLAFLDLLVATHEPCEPEIREPLVLRLQDGRRSPEHARIRERFGVAASEW